MPLGLSDINQPYLEVFERTDGIFDWRLVAGNGEIVCSSHQGYTNEHDTLRGWNTTRELAAVVTDIRRA